MPKYETVATLEDVASEHYGEPVKIKWHVSGNRWRVHFEDGSTATFSPSPIEFGPKSDRPHTDD